MQTKNIDYCKSLEIWEDRSKTSYTYFKFDRFHKQKNWFAITFFHEAKKNASFNFSSQNRRAERAEKRDYDYGL